MVNNAPLFSNAPLFGTVLYYDANTGLCNQLFALVGKLCYTVERHGGVVFVASFLTQIWEPDTVPFRAVVDVAATNAALKREEFHVRVADYNSYTLHVTRIEQNGHDVMPVNSVTDTRAFDMKASAFQSASPCSVTFTVDDTTFTYTEPLPQSNGIVIAPSRAFFGIEYHTTTNLFFDLMNCIHFHPDLLTPLRHLHCQHDVQVMHLRTEADAIAHWGLKSKLGLPQFKTALENAYIRALQQMGDKRVPLIVLTGDSESRVIQHARQVGYQVVLPPKISTKRELAALGDLCVSALCERATLFIGLADSTFSFLVHVRLSRCGVKTKQRCYFIKAAALHQPQIYVFS